MNLDWLTIETIQMLLQGILLTLVLTIVTSGLSLVTGVAVGTLRLSSRRRRRWLAGIYIGVFRNVPALVLIIFLTFAVPNVFPLNVRQRIFFDNAFFHWFNEFSGFAVSYYVLAVTLALVLNSGAYLAELYRAGVGTIAQEHIDAARSLGASQWVVFWQILLPQGLRAAFPAVSTRLIHNMKNTALAAFVSVPEFFQGTQIAITRTFRAVEYLTLAAMVYLLLSYMLAAVLRVMERWLNRRRVSSIFEVA